ncbi:MAG: sulfide/dihydroorotate dehydrogenase-like FAD/NAD-binding protein, partial [Caldisericia bacterium]
VYEKGERIPLTIADYEKDEITAVFQTVGLTTYLLSYKNVGEHLSDIVGPLGTPSELTKYDGTVVIIGGGVGIAPIYPITKGFKNLGNKVITILGARSKNLLFWEERFKDISDEILITTDDGSYGIKGFVTDALKNLIDRGEKISQVTAIGPPIMMRNVCNLTKPYNIKTIVSLNSIMVDGTGMCGVCRVEVGKETKLTCQDGPEFDGHLVNFDLLFERLKMYREEEKIAMNYLEDKRRNL